MSIDLQDQGGRIALRAGELIARYGEADPDEPEGGAAQKVAKRDDWRGFKIKLLAPEESGHGMGAVRIRLNGELIFYARLERGWHENIDHVSDIRAKPGDWPDAFMRLR
jgi:hypothetical protein